MKFFNTSLFTVIFFLISKSNAAVIYVSDVGDDELGNGSSEAPYLTIQKGIDEAYYMDTVMVLDGIYTGGVTIDNKQISLIGESMTDTKLNVPITEPNISILNLYNYKVNKLDIIFNYIFLQLLISFLKFNLRFLFSKKNYSIRDYIFFYK